MERNVLSPSREMRRIGASRRARLVKYLGLAAACFGALSSAFAGDYVAACSIVGAALSSASVMEVAE